MNVERVNSLVRLLQRHDVYTSVNGGLLAGRKMRSLNLDDGYVLFHRTEPLVCVDFDDLADSPAQGNLVTIRDMHNGLSHDLRFYEVSELDLNSLSAAGNPTQDDDLLESLTAVNGLLSEAANVAASGKSKGLLCYLTNEAKLLARKAAKIRKEKKCSS